MAATIRCALLLSAGAGLLPPHPASAESPRPPAVRFQELKLKNGLRVIFSEDHAAPTCSIALTYDVGSRDERPGRTGFAHLFEHMMFQGSQNVGKGEHFILIETNGGSMNGTTNSDRTNYFQTLPRNQLELGLFLEADRMRSLEINQANLDNQRQAVQEERRLRMDNQPYGQTFEAIGETAYDNFAYQHSTIGSMEDLNAATLGDVTEFFKTYYAPNNAVLSLVGDFETVNALARIRKHFEPIPAQPAPAVPDLTEPEQNGERRKTLEDGFARAPRIDIVYKIPPGNTADWYAVSVAAGILAGGQSSRLFQKLVKEREEALAVSGGAQQRRGPSLASIAVTVRPGKDPAAVEKVVYEEIARLGSEPVLDWELGKTRQQVRRQRAQLLQSTLSRAVQLGQYAVTFGDPGLINQQEEKVNGVTKEDIQRAARTYLKETNRTVIVTVPKPARAGGERSGR